MALSKEYIHMFYLVTGDLGLIGSHLVETLVKRGDRVRVTDNFSAGKRGDFLDFKDVEVVEIDTRDLKSLVSIFHDIDGVFYFFASPQVRSSLEELRKQNSLDDSGVLNVIVAARDAGAKRLVYSIPRENIEAPTFMHIRGLETVALHYSNIYSSGLGFNEVYASVMDDSLKQGAINQQFAILGNDIQVSDFVHIDDVIRAHILAMESKRAGKGEIVNIGSREKDKYHEAKELLDWEPTKAWFESNYTTKNFENNFFLKQEKLPSKNDIKIAIIGLGYVGLPLAVAFGKSRFTSVIGFDKNMNRVESLRSGCDSNNEISQQELASSVIEYTSESESLTRANVIIVTVPTPITSANQPDLTLLQNASRDIGTYLQRGSVVIFESTVYPGVTETVCVPIIEEISKLVCGVDWSVGYSPERTNPGDSEHTIEKVIKVVSGMDQETLDFITEIYGEICKAGVHQAPNIKTAEAEKVIENIQRDLNIALMNELAVIFHKLGIHTRDVLEAAGTKWNFHTYQPGLVGGHCIGVDPHYLIYRAQEVGHHPEVLLAGRRINNWMPEYIAELMIKGLAEAQRSIHAARILILGLTFKEDICDVRNSKISSTIEKLNSYGAKLFGYDPNLDRNAVEKFDVDWIGNLSDWIGYFDGVILATPHKEFKVMHFEDIVRLFDISQATKRGVFIDVKSLFLSDVRSKSPSNIIYKCL